jgi:putative transposase
LQQNAISYVPRQKMRTQVTSVIREILHATDRKTANERLAQAVSPFEKSAPDLAEWMEGNIPEGLTVLELPPKHRKRFRTSNCVARINKEIKRRTKVVSLFPNEESCFV